MSARLDTTYDKWSEVPSGLVDQFIRRIKERLTPERGLSLLRDADKFDQWISAGNDIVCDDADAIRVCISSDYVSLNELFDDLEGQYEMSHFSIANGVPVVTLFTQGGASRVQRSITATNGWTPLIEGLEIKHLRKNLFLIR